MPSTHKTTPNPFSKSNKEYNGLLLLNHPKQGYTKYKHTHTHKHIHTQTHTHTHKHIHTQTHTHTLRNYTVIWVGKHTFPLPVPKTTTKINQPT